MDITSYLMRTASQTDLDILVNNIQNGETVNLYDDISTLTLSTSPGAANAYLYTQKMQPGYIKNITVNASAAGSVKVYIYKLLDDGVTYYPMNMFFSQDIVVGENIINVDKIIDYEFYIAFTAYNGAKVLYKNLYNVTPNTIWIYAGEPSTNTPAEANKFNFGISVNYGIINTLWGYLPNNTYTHSLFLNVPDFAMTSQGSTGVANSYFIFDKFDKGYISRIYIKGLAEGDTTITLYRISGDSYVPFKSYSKHVVNGSNFITVNEWIYCDFYVGINGKFAYITKSVGVNNSSFVSYGVPIPTSTSPTGKYYFGVYLEYTSRPVIEKYKQRMYSLNDAFMAWNEGNKFPVCFAGDSTTDGYQTTGYSGNVIGTDHVCPNIYTKLLEDMLKKEFPDNTSLRIYNAGFSGQTAAWFDNNFYAEIINNTNYSDTMMLGISFGINDRPKTTAEYYAVMARFENIIKKCYDNGIQPFLLTCQAGVEYSSRETVKRYEYITNSYANKIKYALAEKYNLELIDVSEFTHNFITNSGFTGTEIIADHCHFNNIGHKYEAGMFFANIIPRTIWVEKETKIGFDTPGLKTSLLSDANSASAIKTLSTTPANGFKMQASATNTTDVVIMDIWIFINSDHKLTLKSYCGTPYNQYIVIDGYTSSSKTLTSSEQTIENLDLGLHRITVHSGSGNINFYGLKLS